jgi:hypothetical protein
VIAERVRVVVPPETEGRVLAVPVLVVRAPTEAPGLEETVDRALEVAGEMTGRIGVALIAGKVRQSGSMSNRQP